MRVEKEPKTEIVAVEDWPSNSELIADIARVGHLKKKLLTVDTTYGLGNWWKLFRPDRLLMHDKFTGDGVDFRHLPYPDDEIPQIAYDPPYVSVGGRETSGLGDFFDRYGLRGAPKGHRQLQRLIDDGLSEQARILRPGTGRLVVKVANYVSGGRLRPGVKWTLDHAETLGLEVVDWFVHKGDVRPQPDGRETQHARQNASHALVFRKPRRRTMR